jgi:2-amino-4-hydroxy-6-hydroxymethyldihydropteridine diphosphokinase
VPECYLSLGSNRGDRLGNLSEALGRIAARWRLAAVSAVYETDPQIVTDQEAFLNLCCRIDAEPPAGAVLRGAHEIEAALGRDRSRERPKGPRMVDIDLLLWGADTIRESDLTIPHPGLTERQFVLRPLLEIAPGLLYPGDGRSLAALSASLPGQGVYCYGNAVVYSA